MFSVLYILCIFFFFNLFLCLFFFFQAEDGIRDWSVTGVQTCALPISARRRESAPAPRCWVCVRSFQCVARLRIRTRRLRCCRSGNLMHSPRRFLIVSLAFFASASVVRSAAAAQAYVIADAQTGYILEEQEPRKKLQVGSLTKIATACVVLDWSERKSGDLNAAVAIPPDAFQGTTENNIGFQPGDSVTLRDLLYAALVQSDNIAAYTLAYHVGSQLGWVEPGAKLTPADMFVAQMNALAKHCKMESTRL